MDLELTYAQAVALVVATATTAIVGRAFPLRTATAITAAVALGLALLVDPGAGTLVVISALGLALMVGHALRELVARDDTGEPASTAGPAEPSAAVAGSTWRNPHGLSPRETEVLALIAAGDSNQEIAESLHISMATVKTHVNHIFTKTAVRDRAQAVAYAYEQGLTGSTPGLIPRDFHLGGDAVDG